MDIDIENDLDRPEGEREAFTLWDGVCRRKMRCVSEATGKPIRGLYLWQNKYEWKLESDVGLAEVTQLMQDRGKLDFQELLSEAADRLRKMLQDDSVDHKDQRENIRLLASIAFAQQADGPNTLIDARSITLGPQALSNPQSALRTATGILEANVASSNNERRKGSRKTF